MANAKELSGKVKWELVPPLALEEVARVFDEGARRYGVHNWAEAVPPDEFYSMYWAAMFRHMMAYRNGEVVDGKSGLPHMAHVAANALILMSGPGWNSPEMGREVGVPKDKESNNKLIIDTEPLATVSVEDAEGVVERAIANNVGLATVHVPDGVYDFVVSGASKPVPAMVRVAVSQSGVIKLKGVNKDA